MTALIATSQRRMPQEGATIACLTGLMKAQRRLKDLRAKLRYMDKEGWEGEQGLRICAHAGALNEKICRFAARTVKRGKEGVKCPQYEGEIGTEPHQGFLLDMDDYIEKEVREEQREIRESRLAKRRQELKVDWMTGWGSYVIGPRGRRESYQHSSWQGAMVALHPIHTRCMKSSSGYG